MQEIKLQIDADNKINVDESYSVQKFSQDQAVNSSAEIFANVSSSFKESTTTENIAIKTYALDFLAENINLDSVICPVGADWPVYYFKRGISHIVAVDINDQQIHNFVRRRIYYEKPYLADPISAGLFKLVKDGELKLFHGDLTDLKDADLANSVSNTSLVDLSNILDYLNPVLGVRVVKEYLELISSGSAIICSALNPKVLEALADLPGVETHYFPDADTMNLIDQDAYPVSNFVVLIKR